MSKNIINDIQVKIIENMNKERMTNTNVQMLNTVSGAIISPLVDKIIKKNTIGEMRDLYNALENMCESDLKDEAFSILHIIIKTSGVRLPSEYQCIVDNPKLRSDFVEEAIADIEDILYDLE